MGNLSTAMLNEILYGQAQLYALLEIQFPSGTKRYSAGPIKSSLGQYSGRINSLGSFYRSASDPDGKIVYPRLDQIKVEDVDQDLAQTLELTEPGGSPVTLRVASPNVPDPNDWLIFVDNFRLDDWSQDEPFVFTLSFSFNDLPLRSPFPRTPILRPDFPNVADPVTYTYHVMLAYGVHSSRGVGDKGMVPTFYVDTVNGWFGPWLGWITVENIYKNDVLQTSGVSVLHPTIGGRLYTVIKFDTPPAATDKVTADITGYRDGTDGAGSLIVGANALKHELVNFIYPADDWKSGAWFADATAPVNIASFTEMQSFLTDLGREKVSRQHGGSSRITGEDSVHEFSDSMGKIGGCGIFFTNDGKIGIRPNDHRTTVLSYSGTRWLKYVNAEGEPDKGAFKQWNDRNILADRVLINFLRRTVTSDYRWSLEVQDLSIGRNSQIELSLPWSEAQLS